jgi:phage tail protein X
MLTIAVKAGFPLDQVLWEAYGRPPYPRMDALLSAALAANPHLRGAPVILPLGTLVALPALAADALPAPLVKLWD